jgi:5-methyltetrahydrofolate--homocysteine methyltransferase
MVDFESLSQSVISGKETQVREQTKAMLDDGVNPLEIVNQGLIAGMNIVGPRFKNGDMFVPEVLMAAKAMATGIEIVKSLIADTDMPSLGKVMIGTVKGDLHDIGKNLVAMMLESGGFRVINLGVDIPADIFIAKIKEHNPDIVAMSALLTTTMLNMKETIALIKEESLSVKCIVGGAPISQEFADEIGAAGYAPDAASAVELCKNLLSV